VPYTGAVTTVNLGAQSILAGSFVKAGGTSAQFLKANGSVDSTAYGTGSVTSVALTMPSAFSVAGSPITTAGTLAVTGAGTVGQYVRGDGSLADFPATTGGGSSVSYYLNGSVSQGTIGGVAYKQLNRAPVFGAGTDITINADGYIASFITDALDPNKLLIPAGNWNFETYFSASSSGGSPSFYVELYKYNGTTFTLIASSSTAPELIAFGTSLNPYFSTLAVPETVLALTDRLALRYYVTHSGRTITLHTENGHLCEVITTFTTGLTALNGLTNQVQFFAVGTSGTDFNIASATDTHTFNLPTASATNRGALSSADWTTFNNKENAITAGTTAQYFRGDKTFQTLNTSVVPELTNLYYTEARVNANTNVAANTAARHNAVTLGTANGLSLSTQVLSLGLASAGVTGALSGTDWSTFNSKVSSQWITTGSNIYYNTGNVGIGTATVTNSKLLIAGTHVSGNSILGVVPVGNQTATIALYNSSVVRKGLLYSDTGFVRLETDSDQLQFLSAGNLGISIFTNGRVFVGSSPSDSGFQFDVNGTGRFNDQLRINKDGQSLLIFPTTTNSVRIQIQSSGGGNLVLGTESSTGGDLASGTSSYASVFSSGSTRDLVLSTNSISRFTINGTTGASTFSSTVRINAEGQSLLILPTTTNSVRIQIQSTGGGNLVLGTDSSTGGNLASGTTAYASVFSSGSTRDLVLGTNSIARLTLNGNTGAATFSSTLQTGGDISLMNASGDIHIRMKDSSGNADRVLLRQATTNDVYVGDIDANNGRLIIRTNGNDAVTIASSGAATFSASVSTPHTTKSANYTLTATDFTVGFDCASSRTANLPDATTCAGRIYVIYQYNTNNGARYVTLDGNGSQTIDGVTTYSLAYFEDFSSVMIQSNGSNWIVIADKLYPPIA
jgi:hypothetical protein